MCINASNLSDLVFAHELGHAKYDLWHPDDIGGTNDDNLRSPVNFDDYNFMNSGFILNLTQALDVFIVRKYQWDQIH